MPTWKELETDFRELQAALQSSRLDVQWGTSGEHWRLAGGHIQNDRRRFEALAHVAGEKLSDTLQASDENYEEILSEPNPMWRWYKGIWKISQNFEYASTYRDIDENNEVVGHGSTGSIKRPGEASAVFCLELSARYPEQEGEESSLRAFWNKYIVHIVNPLRN